MAEIISNRPMKFCDTCGTKFAFDSKDVYKYTKNRWFGLHWFGLFDKEYRFVKCPGCGKEIRLK